MIGLIFKNILKKLVRKLPDVKQKVPFFVTNIVYYAIILLGIVSLLAKLGVDLKNLVAAIGITGLVVGIALKDIITSVISGVIIIIYDNIKIGVF